MKSEFIDVKTELLEAVTDVMGTNRGASVAALNAVANAAVKVPPTEEELMLDGLVELASVKTEPSEEELMPDGLVELPPKDEPADPAEPGGDATISVNVRGQSQVRSSDPRLMTTAKAASRLMPPPKAPPKPIDNSIDLESAEPDPRLLSFSKFPAPVQPRHTACDAAAELINVLRGRLAQSPGPSSSSSWQTAPPPPPPADPPPPPPPSPAADSHKTRTGKSRRITVGVPCHNLGCTKNCEAYECKWCAVCCPHLPTSGKVCAVHHDRPNRCKEPSTWCRNPIPTAADGPQCTTSRCKQHCNDLQCPRHYGPDKPDRVSTNRKRGLRTQRHGPAYR